MDNMQKALTMAAAALLFVIAASVTIFLYSTLIQNTNKIMLASDASRNSAEQATTVGGDYNRKITKGEVILTILNMENEKSYFDSVEVYKANGDKKTFSLDTDGNLQIDYGDLNGIEDRPFSVSYNNSNKTLIYK